MTSTFILGASDPEMASIEELASSAGWRVLYAPPVVAVVMPRRAP